MADQTVEAISPSKFSITSAFSAVRTFFTPDKRGTIVDTQSVGITPLVKEFSALNLNDSSESAEFRTPMSKSDDSFLSTHTNVSEIDDPNHNATLDNSNNQSFNFTFDESGIKTIDNSVLINDYLSNLPQSFAQNGSVNSRASLDNDVSVGVLSNGNVLETEVVFDRDATILLSSPSKDEENLDGTILISDSILETENINGYLNAANPLADFSSVVQDESHAEVVEDLIAALDTDSDCSIVSQVPSQDTRKGPENDAEVASSETAMQDAPTEISDFNGSAEENENSTCISNDVLNDVKNVADVPMQKAMKELSKDNSQGVVEEKKNSAGISDEISNLVPNEIVIFEAESIVNLLAPTLPAIAIDKKIPETTCKILNLEISQVKDVISDIVSKAEVLVNRSSHENSSRLPKAEEIVQIKKDQEPIISDPITDAKRIAEALTPVSVDVWNKISKEDTSATLAPGHLDAANCISTEEVTSELSLTATKGTISEGSSDHDATPMNVTKKEIPEIDASPQPAFAPCVSTETISLISTTPFLLDVTAADEKLSPVENKLNTSEFTVVDYQSPSFTGYRGHIVDSPSTTPQIRKHTPKKAVLAESTPILLDLALSPSDPSSEMSTSEIKTRQTITLVSARLSSSHDFSSENVADSCTSTKQEPLLNVRASHEPTTEVTKEDKGGANSSMPDFSTLSLSVPLNVQDMSDISKSEVTENLIVSEHGVTDASNTSTKNEPASLLLDVTASHEATPEVPQADGGERAHSLTPETAPLDVTSNQELSDVSKGEVSQSLTASEYALLDVSDISTKPAPVPLLNVTSHEPTTEALVGISDVSKSEEFQNLTTSEHALLDVSDISTMPEPVFPLNVTTTLVSPTEGTTAPLDVTSVQDIANILNDVSESEGSQNLAASEHALLDASEASAKPECVPFLDVTESHKTPTETPDLCEVASMPAPETAPSSDVSLAQDTPIIPNVTLSNCEGSQMLNVSDHSEPVPLLDVTTSQEATKEDEAATASSSTALPLDVLSFHNEVNITHLITSEQGSTPMLNISADFSTKIQKSVAVSPVLNFTTQKGNMPVSNSAIKITPENARFKLIDFQTPSVVPIHERQNVIDLLNETIPIDPDMHIMSIEGAKSERTTPIVGRLLAFDDSQDNDEKEEKPCMGGEDVSAHVEEVIADVISKAESTVNVGPALPAEVAANEEKIPNLSCTIEQIGKSNVEDVISDIVSKAEILVNQASHGNSPRLPEAEEIQMKKDIEPIISGVIAEAKKIAIATRFPASNTSYVDLVDNDGPAVISVPEVSNNTMSPTEKGEIADESCTPMEVDSTLLTPNEDGEIADESCAFMEVDAQPLSPTENSKIADETAGAEAPPLSPILEVTEVSITVDDVFVAPLPVANDKRTASYFDSPIDNLKDHVVSQSTPYHQAQVMKVMREAKLAESPISVSSSPSNSISTNSMDGLLNVAVIDAMSNTPDNAEQSDSKLYSAFEISDEKSTKIKEDAKVVIVPPFKDDKTPENVVNYNGLFTNNKNINNRPSSGVLKEINDNVNVMGTVFSAKEKAPVVEELSRTVPLKTTVADGALSAEIARITALIKRNEEDERKKDAAHQEKLKQLDLACQEAQLKIGESVKRSVRLEKEISEKEIAYQQTKIVCDEYKKHNKDLVNYIKSYTRPDLSPLEAELKTVKEHIHSAEAAYIDVHSKFECLRGGISKIKTCSIDLEMEIVELRRAHARLDEKIRGVESSGRAELEELSRAVDEESKRFNTESLKIHAQLRKAQLAATTTQENIEKLTIENVQLSNLCDDIIAGKS